MLLLALAIAPGIAICLYFFLRDKYNPEPARFLLVAFALGILATLPAYFIEREAAIYIRRNVFSTILSSFLAIALVEECLKYLAIRYYCFTRPSFDEPLDGIVYSIFVSMGFATVENLAYVYLHPDYSVILARMFTSVPAHASFAVIMGYYIGKAKFNLVRRQTLLRKGLLLAVLYHGTYDSFIFLADNRWLKQYISEVLIFTGAVASLYTAFRLSRKMLRLHQNTSQQLFKEVPALKIIKATEKDTGLIRSLLLQAWPPIHGSVKEGDQTNFVLNKLYSGDGLQKQLEEGHRFLLIYNGPVPAGFASYSEGPGDICRLHTIYILPAHQGRGIGKVVINSISDEAERNGAKAILIHVDQQNSSKGFYEKAGFVVARTEEVLLTNGYSMKIQVMEKALPAKSGEGEKPTLWGDGYPH